MKKIIRLFSPYIPLTVPEAVKQVLQKEWINRGPLAEQFEKQFCEMFGYEHALSVNSCTSALRLAYDMIKCKYQEVRFSPSCLYEVITTPYTMVATNTAILECGMKPVFADIEYETGNINPESVRQKLTKNTVAIIGVDYAGYPCDWQELQKVMVEDPNNQMVYLVEDAAQAIGAKYHGDYIGKIADMTCFSFQAVKHINTGDGGMFVTNSDLLHWIANQKIWFGIDKKKRVKSPLGDYPEDIEYLGFKYGMNDITATMGIEGLKDLPFILEKRKRIARQYREELKGCKHLTLMEYKDDRESANWMFPIHVENRLKFAEQMREKGIEVAVHNWRNDKYSIFGGLKDLSNTEKLNSDLIHIPLHMSLSEEEIEYIIKTIKELIW